MPYLLILCMEALSHQLNVEANSIKSAIGIKISPRILSYLIYYLLMIVFFFCKGNSVTCNRLRLILDQFCSSSGQLVKYHKFVLTFSKNASPNQKQMVTANFNISRTDSLGKYLACPVFQGRPSSY